MRFNIGLFMIVFCFQISNAQMINLEEYVTGLSNPTDISHAGDDRLFVVERRGKVKIVSNDGSILSTPFIDIDDLVFNASGQDERGLLGIAFHPNYQENGYFFLNFTDNNGQTNVVRFTADSSDPNIADPTSNELIIKIDQPYWNHNGGGIKFGSDGYLYIGMGDGGAGDDPQNYGQNRQSLLGKMLRIDVDNGLPYTIPTDNPFVSDDNTLDEIWAIGMRNPWRFSFDKETGDLWIGDVGQGAVEEIDFEPAGDSGGHNYGWRCYEGNEFTFNTSMANCQEDYRAPVYEIFHQGFSGPCSITGGFVYRGTKYTDLVGQYICADYCSGEFFTVAPDENGGWDGKEVATLNAGISTFGEGVDGELYAATLTSGRIYKILGGVLNATDVIKEINQLTISPNPVRSITTLDVESNKSIDVDFTLIDMSGREVFTKSATINGLYTTQLDLSDQPSGTFILSVNTDRGLITRKIVKQ